MKKKKDIPYFIDQTSTRRPTRQIVRDMKKCSIIVILGPDKTPEMEKEETVARAMNKQIWYRPSPRTVEQLIEKGGEVFPEHQRGKIPLGYYLDNV